MAREIYLAVGQHGSSSDEINLLDTTKHAISQDGLDLSTEGEITATVYITGATANSCAANYRAILTKLTQAESAWVQGDTSGMVSLSVRLDTTNPVFYYVVHGTCVVTKVYPLGHRWEAKLTLTCLPYAFGATYSANTDVSGTFSGGAIQALVKAVKGDVDALTHLEVTDVSGSGVINRLRIARRAGGTIAALGDFDPWVNAEASGGTQTGLTGAGLFLNNYVTLTTSGTAFSGHSKFQMPVGALNTGTFDAYLRVKDSATALGSPTSIAATLDRPAYTTTSHSYATTAPTLALITNAQGAGDGTNSALIALSGSHDVRDLMFLFTPGAGTDATPPAATAQGYELLAYRRFTHSGIAESLVALYRCETAGGTQFPSHKATATTYLARLRFDGEDGTSTVSHLGSITPFTTSASDPTVTIGPAPRSNALAVVVAGGAPVGSSSDVDYWSSSFTNHVSTDPISIGSRAIGASGSSLSVTGLSVGPASWGGFGISIVAPVANDETGYTYQDPIPGDLDEGTYDFWVQGVDGAGGRSLATTAPSVSVGAYGKSAINLTWAVGAGDVKQHVIQVRHTLGSMIRFYEVYTGSSSGAFTLTTLTGAREIVTTDLTATTSAARIRVRIGTVGGGTTRTLSGEIVLPKSGTYRMVRLFGGRDLPDVPELADGTSPTWVVYVDVRSANGRSVTVDMDALWIASHREPQLLLEEPGLALSGKRRWVAQTHRDGQRTIARLIDPSNGSEAGTPWAVGTLRLAPGDNVLAILAEQAAGDTHLANTSVTLTLSITPRYRWQRSD